MTRRAAEINVKQYLYRRQNTIAAGIETDKAKERMVRRRASEEKRSDWDGEKYEKEVRPMIHGKQSFFKTELVLSDLGRTKNGMPEKGSRQGIPRQIGLW